MRARTTYCVVNNVRVRAKSSHRYCSKIDRCRVQKRRSYPAGPIRTDTGYIIRLHTVSGTAFHASKESCPASPSSLSVRGFVFGREFIGSLLIKETGIERPAVKYQKLSLFCSTNLIQKIATVYYCGDF